MSRDLREEHPRIMTALVVIALVVWFGVIVAMAVVGR